MDFEKFLVVLGSEPGVVTKTRLWANRTVAGLGELPSPPGLKNAMENFRQVNATILIAHGQAAMTIV